MVAGGIGRFNRAMQHQRGGGPTRFGTTDQMVNLVEPHNTPGKSVLSQNKAPRGLATLVREAMRVDPFSGAMYVFRAKRADRIKLIFWDGTGLCLFAKRLEDGIFRWPRIEDGVMHLSAAQLSALLEGLDRRRVTELLETETVLKQRFTMLHQQFRGDQQSLNTEDFRDQDHLLSRTAFLSHLLDCRSNRADDRWRTLGRHETNCRHFGIRAGMGGSPGHPARP